MKDEEFTKLTKKQKLNIPELDWRVVVKGVRIALFIPTTKKNSEGYTICAFFVLDKDGNWYRLPNYDCFRFKNAHNYLKGDFENGGVQFFLSDGGEWEGADCGDFRLINPQQ